MNRIKILLVAILTTVLLTISVSGTLAWLQDNTDEVENVFTPTKVDTEIDEDFDNNIKSSIVIINKADSIPVYVRVAVVGNWIDDKGKVVAPWTGSVVYNDTDWIKLGDYYYYKSPLSAGATSNNLLKVDNPITAGSSPVDGAHLEIDVIHQSIQANPTSVVIGEWDVTLDTSGNITDPAATN